MNQSKLNTVLINHTYHNDTNKSDFEFISVIFILCQILQSILNIISNK